MVTNFLGLPASDKIPDIVILPVPYELTTSYGQGTAQGPAACIQASTQVELFDPLIGEDLPANYSIVTAEAWDGQGATLKQQMDSISNYLEPWYNGVSFPVILGGEHGILPAIVHASRYHPKVADDLSNLTIVQIDAHADLREQFLGERFSHACAAARALDFNIKKLYQVGVRAFSKLEYERIATDAKITTYFASHIHGHDNPKWQDWLNELGGISGPVHLTFDIDGLDASLVPATGTPVPGGLTFWQAVETIDALFKSPNAFIISMDINEIGIQQDSPLTQFTAALMATKGIIHHINARRHGRWVATSSKSKEKRNDTYFQSL